jgi:hypothetical protein
VTNNEQLIALARRLVACPGFYWLPGMLAGTVRVLSVDGQVARVGSSKHDWIPVPFLVGTAGLPDLSDAATRGCVLQLVRDAIGYPGASSGTTMVGNWVVRGNVDGVYCFGIGETEAEALVEALEAAAAR